MPVRKIPKNYLSVTGGYSSRKNDAMDAFESLLEKEFLILLDHDEAVLKFEVQPVRIPVAGVRNGYVPDILVHYKPEAQTGEVRMPLLAEIKHSSDLARNEARYAPKFAAARDFAEAQGWIFQVITEQDIRTPRLANLKFLREYRNISVSATDVAKVLHCFHDNAKVGLQALLSQLPMTEGDRLHWLPVVWAMIQSHQLHVDMEQLFHNEMLVSQGDINS